MVGLGEIEVRGEPTGDVLMACEFLAVVGCNSVHARAVPTQLLMMARLVRSAVAAFSLCNNV